MTDARRSFCCADPVALLCGETPKKKDIVQEKARELQSDVLKSLESLCANVGVADPRVLAQQLLLLANGYLIMEPLLGKTQAVKLTLQTAEALVGHQQSATKPAVPKFDSPRALRSGKAAMRAPIDANIRRANLSTLAAEAASAEAAGAARISTVHPKSEA